VVARAAKTKFLGELRCPKCKTTVLFVILAKAPGARGRE
jgi:phage FluMu protein Com